MAINDSIEEWRKYGDGVAYEAWIWAYHARWYEAAAVRLRDIVVAETKPENLADDAMPCLMVGRFTMAMALELAAKAYYLKHGDGPSERVYTHNTTRLVPGDILSEEELEILTDAVACVEWAGRYPTPRWDRPDAYKKWEPPTLPNGKVDLNRIVPNASIAQIDKMPVGKPTTR